MYCEEIREIVSNFSLIRECDTILNGMLRLSTPFQNIEGSFIDLFFGEQNDMYSPYILTDLGGTAAYLFDMNIRLYTTKKRRAIIEDICNSLGVIDDNGEFKIHLGKEDLKNIPDAMVRLSQACIRISDLAFYRQNKEGSLFLENLEEFFESKDIKYDTELEIRGRYNRLVKVDFKVYGKKINSIVMGLSAHNNSSSHNIANEIFRKWHDIQIFKNDMQFISIYDANGIHFKDEDIERISEYSTIFEFPGEEENIYNCLVA